jgi:hypothetical protein
MTNEQDGVHEVADQLIAKLAAAEIALCTTQEQLLIVKKRWDKYLSLMNKAMAGKGNVPYFDENGNVQVLDD